jgi:hypothetical protein
MIAPQELLDTSLGQIRTLTAFLREQLGERSDSSESETAESRACSETLAQLTLLIQRLEATGLDNPQWPEVSGSHGVEDAAGFGTNCNPNYGTGHLNWKALSHECAARRATGG